MDLFKFNPTSDPTVLERGERINNTDSKLWVERYRDPGEVTIQAKLSSGIRELLPEDTLISHVKTLEVMRIENHEINEDKTSDPVVKVTGRSFDSYLENRVIGVEAARVSSTFSDYTLASALTWNQAVTLINDHIYTPANADDGLVNIRAVTSVTGSGTTEARTLKPSDIYGQVLEILTIDDLGIRTLRRNTFGGAGSNTETQLEIYRGVDRSNKVIFSWKHGDLDSAEYLFSGKKAKTSALVVGRYVWTVVDFGPTKYNRRFMVVDANDIDGYLSAAPTGGTLTTILAKMATRGRQELARQTQITLSRTDVSQTSKNRYREHYNLGDIVMLDGNYGQMTKMRVIEYVEIEDENGDSGHPTLAVPGV